MISVHAEPDLQVWVGMPGQWDDATWADPRDWAREVAQTLWADHQPEPGGQGVDHLALALAMHAQSPLAGAPHRRTWLWLPNPTDEPLPLHLEGYVEQGERGQALRELARADQDGAVEAPVVEPFASTALGTGLRVLRYEVDPDDGAVVLILSYAFRAGGLDVRLWTSTYDTAAGLRALDDIDALARSLMLVQD